MGANHPENPFGVPVGVEGLLAGLPPQRLHAQTQSRRGVLSAEGQVGDRCVLAVGRWPAERPCRPNRPLLSSGYRAVVRWRLRVDCSQKDVQELTGPWHSGGR